MPHYFVEGWRDGKPMPALYIQADNPDAAVARAAQLKMQEVTGVRLAKTTPPPAPPSKFDMLILLSFALSAVEHFSIWVISIPIILSVFGFLIKVYQKQIQMQAEIDDLRKQLQSGVGLHH